MSARNPYLLLGVDYGAPADEARRRFARAARRVRRAAADPTTAGGTTVEDLNWALHEIQNQAGDPFDSVAVFRVPADPDVFTPRGEGMFAPPPVPLPRRTSTTAADIDAVLGGLADELGVLLGAVVPRTVRFDHGYVDQEGRPV